MRKYLFLLFSLLALAACDNDDKKEATIPTFQGFKVEWNSSSTMPAPGDVLTITAVQNALGSYIYDAKYTWLVKTNVNGEDDQYNYTPENVVYGHVSEAMNGKADPVLKYIVPDKNSGYVEVRFTAAYQFSADCLGQKGEPVEVDKTVKYIGNIDVTGSALLGKAAGSCIIKVINTK